MISEKYNSLSQKYNTELNNLTHQLEAQYLTVTDNKLFGRTGVCLTYKIVQPQVIVTADLAQRVLQPSVFQRLMGIDHVINFTAEVVIEPFDEEVSEIVKTFFTQKRDDPHATHTTFECKFSNKWIVD